MLRHVRARTHASVSARARGGVGAICGICVQKWGKDKGAHSRASFVKERFSKSNQYTQAIHMDVSRMRGAKRHTVCFLFIKSKKVNLHRKKELLLGVGKRPTNKRPTLTQPPPPPPPQPRPRATLRRQTCTSRRPATPTSGPSCRGPNSRRAAGTGTPARTPT
jgi:hypothetical protein